MQMLQMLLTDSHSIVSQNYILCDTHISGIAKIYMCVCVYFGADS